MENLWFNGVPAGGNVVEEHQRRIAHQMAVRRQLRDTQNPYDISVTEFIKLFRMPQQTVLALVEELRPLVVPRTSKQAIPLEVKVLVALSFYASGSYQRILGRAVDLNIGQTTFSVHLSEITDALNNPQILTRYIHFPTTEEERQLVIRRNARLGMPRTLGFIDGTLVKIVPPPRNLNREAYFCRKGYTAVNAQIICDSNLYIMNVVARFPGSCNDAFIWSQSAVRNAVIGAYHASRCWLLGDSGYGHEPWLQLPLPNAEPGTPEYAYTLLHCHCRNAVERCIGVLKGRWRCLLNDRTLHYTPHKSGLIINACAVLHNLCVMQNVPEPMHQRDDDNADDDENEEDDDIEDDADILALRELARREQRFLINFAQQQRLHEDD